MGLQPQAKVILASGSPRRKELLASVGVEFSVRVPEVDETVEAHWSPAEAVEQLALRKGRAVVDELLHRRSEKAVLQPALPQTGSPRSEAAASEEPVLVIAADTIVVLDGEVMGKPVDAEDAVRMLRRLSGREHDVYSGLAVFRVGGTVDAASSSEGQVGHLRTAVRFRPLSDDMIRRYVTTGEPLDKAGAYAIQGLGATLVEGIDGDYFTVVGMPLVLLARFLEDWGYRLF